MARTEYEDQWGNAGVEGKPIAKIDFVNVMPRITIEIKDAHGARAAMQLTLDDWINLIKRIPHALSEKEAERARIAFNPDGSKK